MRINKLNESFSPHKGIFWFIPENDYQMIYLDIPDDDTFIGNSKNGLTYTHEKTWKDLVTNQPSYIKNKLWNYYPRGRVELTNMTARVFLNPNINIEKCQKQIIDKFNLNQLIVKFIADGSSHYKCYLD